MWIIIRLLIGIIILLIVEFYFVKRLNLAVKHLFPKFYENKFRLIRKVYLVWINLYPLALIFIFTYFAVTGSYLSSPEYKIIDYFLIYPFWINFLLMIQTAIYFLIIDLISLYIYPVRFDPFYYLGIAILLLVEFYFIKRLNLAIKHFFPKFYEKNFRIVRRVYLSG